MHCEVAGEFNSTDIFSPKFAFKHQHYQKFMDDLSIQKRCCDHCGKQTKVRLYLLLLLLLLLLL